MTGEVTREEMADQVRDVVSAIEYERDHLPDFDATGLAIWRTVLRELEAGGWRPIESAPKGDDPIDVWRVFTRHGEVTSQRREADAIWDGEAWVSDDGGELLEWKDELGQRSEVTHWRPLPSPPTTSDGGGENE